MSTSTTLTLLPFSPLRKPSAWSGWKRWLICVSKSFLDKSVFLIRCSEHAIGRCVRDRSHAQLEELGSPRRESRAGCSGYCQNDKDNRLQHRTGGSWGRNSWDHFSPEENRPKCPEDQWAEIWREMRIVRLYGSMTSSKVVELKDLTYWSLGALVSLNWAIYETHYMNQIRRIEVISSCLLLPCQPFVWRNHCRVYAILWTRDEGRG